MSTCERSGSVERRNDFYRSSVFGCANGTHVGLTFARVVTENPQHWSPFRAQFAAMCRRPSLFLRHRPLLRASPAPSPSAAFCHRRGLSLQQLRRRGCSRPGPAMRGHTIDATFLNDDISSLTMSWSQWYSTWMRMTRARYLIPNTPVASRVRKLCGRSGLCCLQRVVYLGGTYNLLPPPSDTERSARPALILGYRNGLQIWDCTDMGAISEVLNLKGAPFADIIQAQILPTPVPDPMAEQRPLLGLL